MKIIKIKYFFTIALINMSLEAFGAAADWGSERIIKDGYHYSMRVWVHDSDAGHLHAANTAGSYGVHEGTSESVTSYSGAVHTRFLGNDAKAALKDHEDRMTEMRADTVTRIGETRTAFQSEVELLKAQLAEAAALKVASERQAAEREANHLRKMVLLEERATKAEALLEMLTRESEATNAKLHAMESTMMELLKRSTMAKDTGVRTRTPTPSKLRPDAPAAGAGGKA